MINELQVFSFKNKNLRTLGTFDSPLFCLKDICNFLNIKNINDISTRLKLRFKDGVGKTYPIIDNLGRTQETTFITEPQLYYLVMRSDKKEAIDFQNWVFNEVLPAIRKTGMYDTERNRLLYHIDWRNDIIIQLENEIYELENQIEDLTADTINPQEQLILQNGIKNRAYQLANSDDELPFFIKKIYNRLYNYFGIVKYSQLLKDDLKTALNIINHFQTKYKNN